MGIATAMLEEILASILNSFSFLFLYCGETKPLMEHSMRGCTYTVCTRHYMYDVCDVICTGNSE